MFRFSSAIVPFVAAVLLAASPARSAAPVDSNTAMRERILRTTEFFNTILPGVLEEKNVTLHFMPKFSDLRRHEFIRYPLELRYGIGHRWELNGGATLFGPNPFKSGPDHRWGPGEIRLGARYDVGPFLNWFDEMTLGLETRIPVGKPPPELNDHYTHVKPFVSMSRQLASRPDFTVYANLSYDRSVELARRAAPPLHVVRRNIIEVAPGVLYKPGEFGYFTEYRFSHITEQLAWHLAHEVLIGSIWDVPIRRSAGWKLPGKWQIEMALKVGREEGRGNDLGVVTRVNWKTTLREVLSHASGKVFAPR
ncbi:MAG: hypothetical protein RIQ93_2777 [Verrucomicrobiota bacterium]|jgi:hypothetical protein